MNVSLVLPPEVLDDAGLTGQEERGSPVVAIILEATTVVEVVTTAAAVGAQVNALSAAIRAWAQRRRRMTRITVRGIRSTATFDLPPNVSADRVSRIIQDLLELNQQ